MHIEQKNKLDVFAGQRMSQRVECVRCQVARGPGFDGEFSVLVIT